MPSSPPAGWFADPDGSGGQRYWDGAKWTTHRRAAGSTSATPGGVRQRWRALPKALRLLVPIALVVVVGVVGLIAWMTSPTDYWSRLPKRLSCQTQDGPRPSTSIAVATVEAKRPRKGVLELLIRFEQALPQSPSGSRAKGFVGYVLTYSVANNGKKFAELGPEQDTDDLAIIDTLGPGSGDRSMRPDRDTNARRTSADTVQVYLELKRFGIENEVVNPSLTLEAQFNTPSTTTVKFAPQVCQ
ncbi:hypothetical protein BST27_17430 [Mycobacterium intermedium]|uniref:DUF2510 domain-containing protein n=1 Tax=Mycobacterium intermedium TaxID=28445 RepID=A0A1E3S8N1_MYCIE|nr:hypothetical protein BHQ20_22205 [Mycobacterium intermedium]OPE45544.1 hypothetical protein BV508_29255 [Mycobacterium intermedium]ORB01523.1 hypothetical protein BST27_17430 [Mycobacterium intermedium]